jgi:hypothetical protein
MMQRDKLRQREPMTATVPAIADLPLASAGSTGGPTGESDVQYSIPELDRAKAKLNAEKSRIDEFYDKFPREWNRISLIMDNYAGLRNWLAKDLNAQFPTNASLKYIELYDMLGIGDSGRPLRAFFNAELPGAALCAFNHRMRTRGVGYEWFASSYVPAGAARTMGSYGPATGLAVGSAIGHASSRPTSSVVGPATGHTVSYTAGHAPNSAHRAVHDQTALGDVYGLYAHNRDNWLMSDTNNGDMTVVDNILDIERRIGGSIDFYSHDAGIDVSGDYNRQEELNARLHLGCAIAGLLCLRVSNGAREIASGACADTNVADSADASADASADTVFIGKQYTAFETITWNLIAIYSRCFRKFQLVKPLASRERNSEVYLVGTGFTGLDARIRSFLLDLLANFSMRPAIPRTFVQTAERQFRAIWQFATAQSDLQCRYIAEIIDAFMRYRDNPDALSKWAAPVKAAAQAEWKRDHPLRRLPRDKWLPSRADEKPTRKY